MKLRIKGNTIRLRLLRNEVEQLGRNGKISEKTDFGGGIFFAYSIEVSGIDRLSASFNDKEIIISLPADLAKDWIANEAVGLEGEDGALKISIEKDFVCLDRKDDEDAKNAYPHPKMNC